MRPVPLGAKGTYRLVAQPFHLASQFKDSILPPVFATPMMVLFMENAALNAVRDYLEPGESCVGAGISLKHLAATPVGHAILAEAEIVKVDGRRIEFSVVARDEVEVIGTGTHERVVVNMERFAKKLAEKAK
jgi:fluoroacetyl-CoA thioesterase